jgi:hypothetical protein
MVLQLRLKIEWFVCKMGIVPVLSGENGTLGPWLDGLDELEGLDGRAARQESLLAWRG